MGRRTYYCANCMNSFVEDVEACPNLACSNTRPTKGWGVLLGKGDLLDRHYFVRKVLAVAGAGITYLAQEIDEDGNPNPPDLAIKVLFAQRDSGPFLRRLANEAQILQELNHENIVQCHGFVNRVGREPYLLTLFEPGGNLYDHIKKVGPLGALVAGGILTQILHALDVAHQRGVVHRDLKPQNVLLRTVVPREVIPRCLVADFGIAKVEGGLNEGLTQVGTFVGTPEFAAPEQFRGAAPEPATDIFAAGALLFYLLTGRPPVRFSHRRDIGTSLMELLDQVPPKLEGAAYHPVLQRVLDGTMQPEIADRWTVQQVLTTLRELNEAIHTRPDGTVELTAHDQEPAIVDPEMHATLVPGGDGDLATFHMQEAEALPKEMTDEIDKVKRPDAKPDYADAEQIEAASDAARMVPATLKKKAARPAPEPEPPAPAPPAPAPPPAAEPPAPEPAPKRTRMRLRPEKDDRPAAQPAMERQAMTLDDLFGSAPSNEVVVNTRAQPGNDLSLDDLFGDPKPAEPEPEPPPKVSKRIDPDDFWGESAGEPVQDAVYETVIDEAPALEAAAPDTPAVLQTWVPDDAVGLPASLPSDGAELLRLLGGVHPDDRAAIVDQLRSNDPGSALSSYRSGGDPALGRGVALAIGLLEKSAYGGTVRNLLSDGDPGVRACAAEALGHVGTAATMVQLNRVLDDADPRVRQVGAHALARGGARTGRQDLVRGWIGRLANDSDPAVKAAHDSALALL